MLSGAWKESYILVNLRLARALCGYFHLKIIARVKATKASMTVIKLLKHRIVLVALSNDGNKKFDYKDSNS